MRAWISGGCGFLGSNLCNRLLADGHEVTAFDDMSRGNAKRLHIGVRTIKGDIRDASLVSQSMREHDVVIHMAMVQGTITFTENPRRTIDVAVWGTLNVLHACEENGVRDFMLLSSSEAYNVPPPGYFPTAENVPLMTPDPRLGRFAYGGGKHAMEIMCNAYYLGGVFDRLVTARPHNIVSDDMGHEHMLPEFCDRLNALIPDHPSGVIPFPILGTGQETRSLCHVDDAVEGLVLMLEKAPKGSEIYHLGTEYERTVAEMAHAIAAEYGREIEVVPGKLPDGAPPRRCPDITKLRGLGYEPRVSYESAVKRSVAGYKKVAHVAA